MNLATPTEVLQTFSRSVGQQSFRQRIALAYDPLVRTAVWQCQPPHSPMVALSQTCSYSMHFRVSLRTVISNKSLPTQLYTQVSCHVLSPPAVMVRSPTLSGHEDCLPGAPHKATMTDVDEKSPSRHGGGQCLAPAGERLLRNGESAALSRIPCTMLKELTVGYTVDHWTWASPTMMTSQFGLMGAVNLFPPLSFNNARHVTTPPSVEPPPVPNSWDPFWGGARSLSCFESVVGEHKHPAKRTRSHRSIEAPPSRSKLLGCCE